MNRILKGMTVTVFALVVAATSMTLAQQRSADTALRAAIETETVRGMSAAIEQYKRVADTYRRSDPSTAAQALLRMAEAYEKLGNAEARKIYERVIKEFGGQKEAVAIANERLGDAAGDAQARARLAGLAGLREERLWRGPTNETYGRPSQDGRYFAYVDWLTGFGNLAIRDLRTGQKVLITRDANRQAWVEDPLPSADGKRIAYRFGEDGEIRVIDIDGNNMKLLLRDHYDHLLQAWSPDNKYIVAKNFKGDRTFAIVLISTVDGSIRQLKSTGKDNPSVGGYSPDGRFLVYARDNDPRDAEGGVFALAADGSRQYRLVEGSRQAPTTFSAPLWSPDGTRVIFMSNRSGTAGMWSVRVADGRPAGEPVSVRVAANGNPLALTRDGALYYEKRENLFEAYTADFDAGALNIANPMPVTDQAVGNNRSPEVSPDGASVAFVRQRTGMPLAIVVRPLDRDAPERIVGTIPGGIVYAPRALQWFPDSQSLLVFERQRKRFVRVDVRSGETKVVFEAPWELWMGALSADGESLFYSATEGGILRLVRRRLDNGSETELFQSRSLGGADLFGLVASPDGNYLAFTRNVENNRRILYVISTGGGTPREVYRSVPGGFWPATIQWMPDSRTLMVLGNRVGPDESVSDTQRMYAIAISGGNPRLLTLSVEGIINWSFSPDSRRFVYGTQTSAGELWVIRNLLKDAAEPR